jgi:hypothetical protein
MDVTSNTRRVGSPRSPRVLVGGLMAAVACAIAGSVACSGGRPQALTDDHGLPPTAASPSSGGDPGYSGLGDGTFCDPDAGDPDAGDTSRGVCGCVDLHLPSDLPTIYFVLDRSSSMQVDDKWDRVRTVAANIVTAIGPRAKFGAAYFPGDSTDGCSVGQEVMPARPGDAPAGTQGPTAQRLLRATGIDAFGGTPTGATLKSLLPKLQASGGKTYVVLATDGGPNCDFDATCDAAHCMVNIEQSNPQCSVNGASCCTTDTYGPANCLDSDATNAAVGALTAAGIPTFVVGMPGSGPYADLLDQLAVTGGTAQAQSPKYYRVDTADSTAIDAALSKVAAHILGTCNLQLQAVPDPTKVNVYLDGQVVAQQGADGWSLDGTAITLQGQSCQHVLDGTALSVRVVAGCPTVLF